MTAVLQDQPLPARLVPWPRPSATTLQRCLLLAALLHVWLVVWLGSAPGGTAQPGQGVWGAINITLRGPANEGLAAPTTPASPSSTAPGDAPAPRWGGAVRESQPLPDSEPGAAQLGLPAERQPDAAAPASPAPLAALAAPPATAPMAADAVAPAIAVAPVAAVATTPAAAPPAPGVDDRAAAAAPEPATRQIAPSLRRQGAPSSPALSRVAALPQPGPLPSVIAPNALVAAPPLQLASPLRAPVPRAAVPPLATAAAPQVLQELAVPPAPGDAPPALRQLQPAAAAISRVAEPALAPTAQPLQLPQLHAVPGAALPAVGAAAADADTRAGHDVATPPAAPASAAPRLNLQLARPRGGELSRHDSRGVLPVLPRPPERDDKLARDIDKAARSDCRSAYSALGPLAVIPLALDAVRKDGACKW